MESKTERDILSDISAISLHDSRGITSASEIFIPDLIISGGQQGADLGGLYAAQALGIPTGGYAPQGFRTENGCAPDLGSIFGLIESDSPEYWKRTQQNVAMSNAVIAIAKNHDSAGTLFTRKCAFGMQVPYFAVTLPALPSLEDEFVVVDLKNWLIEIQPSVVMIAGNRESVAKGIFDWTHKFLIEVFT